jgi:transcriptional regulator with XRE-family HTH domain
MATVDCDRGQRERFGDEDDEELSFGGRLGEDVGFVGASRTAGHESLAAVGSRPALHRIGEVRRRQGVTLRNVARRLGMSLPVVRRQEQADCDLRLSELHQWQEVLEVPVAELLVEGDGQLSGPVLERSRMVKLMKTAAAIRERSRGTAVDRMVEMLVEQILEIMPELADVTPWHTVGQRRTLDELGRAGRTTVPDEIFRRSSR